MTLGVSRVLVGTLTSALVLGAGVLGVGGTAPAMGSTVPARSVSVSMPRVLADCLTPSRRPQAITITCADANTLLRRASWKRWGLLSARGTGVLVVNDCKPNCAAGHFHRYPVTERLHRVVRHRFSRLTVHLVHPAKGMPRTQVFRLATRPI